MGVLKRQNLPFRRFLSEYVQPPRSYMAAAPCLQNSEFLKWPQNPPNSPQPDGIEQELASSHSARLLFPKRDSGNSSGGNARALAVTGWGQL